MNNHIATIESAGSAIDGAVTDLFETDAVRSLSDDQLVGLTVAVGRLLRRAESMLIEVAGEVDARSQSVAREERFSVQHGCRDVSDFLRWATGVGGASASSWIRASAAVRGATNILSGGVQDPPLPAVRGALCQGALGVDGLLAVSGPLMAARPRADMSDFAAADIAIAEVAVGQQGDALPVSVQELTIHATAWATALDQDGAEPDAADACRKRSLSIGNVHDGLVRITAHALPDVAATLRRITDATTNPRVGRVHFTDAANDEDADRDDRTPAQRRHDALATALSVAATSQSLPTLGGAAPTLVVHVSAEAIASGRGHAFIDNQPVALSVARHVGCSGTIQRVVTNTNGAIVSLGAEERVFNRHQRRAIALRDGGCVIPGCTVRASWCEVHHVTDWAEGGKTHTDNGVLLCWNHHRFIDTNGWSIRMRDGTPETRAPKWLDPSRQWRKPPPPPAVSPPTRRT